MVLKLLLLLLLKGKKKHPFPENNNNTINSSFLFIYLLLLVSLYNLITEGIVRSYNLNSQIWKKKKSSPYPLPSLPCLLTHNLLFSSFSFFSDFNSYLLCSTNIQQAMAGYFGVLVSDPWLQNQFTQVELRTLKTSVSFRLFSLTFGCFPFCGMRLLWLRCVVLAVHGDAEGEQRLFEADGAAGQNVQAEARRRESDGARKSCDSSGVVSGFGDWRRFRALFEGKVMCICVLLHSFRLFWLISILELDYELPVKISTPKDQSDESRLFSVSFSGILFKTLWPERGSERDQNSWIHVIVSLWSFQDYIILNSKILTADRLKKFKILSYLNLSYVFSAGLI